MNEVALGVDAVARIKPRRRPRTILLLGVRRAAMLTLAPQLRRETVELVRVPDPSTAVSACQRQRFDLVIAKHPIEGYSIDKFLDALRSVEGKCADTFVLVLTEFASEASLEELNGPQLRFANSSDFSRILSVLAHEVLDVAPRVASRLMVEVGLRLNGLDVSRFCQVANLSESGLLVKTGQEILRGEVVDLTFRLPTMPQPIEVSGRVERHTEAHEVQGLGISFIDLDEQDRRQLRHYLEGLGEG